MLREIINKSLIVINPNVKSKKELFDGMINHVYAHDYIINKSKFTDDLRAREDINNTQISDIVALPHCKSKSVEKLFLCILIQKSGIDYQHSTFANPQIIFFIGAGETDQQQYLQVMAKSARLLQKESFRQRILDANSADEILNIIAKFDTVDTPAARSLHLMIFTLNKPELLHEILPLMLESGIVTASITNTVSLAKKLSYDIPIFAGLGFINPGKSDSTKQIFALIPAKEIATSFFNLLIENGIDLNKQGTGYIQIIKIDSILGNPLEEIDL